MGPTKTSDKFQWLQFVHILIQELNETRKAIYRMNYIEALNWLAYFKERTQIAQSNT